MQIGALPHKQPVRFSLIVNQTVQEKMCRVLELADLGGSLLDALERSPRSEERNGSAGIDRNLPIRRSGGPSGSCREVVRRGHDATATERRGPQTEHLPKRWDADRGRRRDAP